MESKLENRRHTRTYTDAVTTARRLQADLINLVDETLLANWDDAGALSDNSLEIMNYLLERVDSGPQSLPPTVVNLLDVLNKVLMLAEYSYRLRTDYVKAPAFDDDEG